jgi:transposase
MEITAQQYKIIAPLLTIPRGKMKISELQALKVILYIAERGCK